MSRHKLLKTARLIHLYFGVFITPALIFFALTGALQTFGLHETNRDHPNYKPARWIAVLGQLHKKQTVILPVRRAQAAGPAGASAQPEAKAGGRPDGRPDGRADARPDSSNAAPAIAATPAPPTRHPLPLRIFFLVVSLGLFVSSVTGLYMSYVYVRNKALVTLTLLAGALLPIPLIFL